jgi:hypothetical protein
LAGVDVSFELEGYDHTRPLTIDPVLTYSSYLGGSGFDAAYGVTTDTGGNIYIAGETASYDFPLPWETPRAPRSARDVFVTKISPDGGGVLYTTILAGSGNDVARAITLHPSGDLFLAGTAGGAGFPVTTGTTHLALKTLLLRAWITLGASST